MKTRLPKEDETIWKLYVDKALNKHTKVAKIVLKSLDGVFIKYTLRLAFQITNNVAEYETLKKGLNLAKEMKQKD